MCKDINDTIVDGRFKDSRPMETVERIRAILKENGLEVREIWNDTCVPYCYSMSIEVLGTIFRVNGKGLTKEFTLASGYGELMERLQMGFINGPNVLKDGDFAVDDGKYEMLPASQLISRGRSWYEKMGKSLYHFTRATLTPEQIVGQYADDHGNVSATPFFDLTTGTKEHLPTILRKRVYATNGCAAGNSPEEAIVQAISEIVERNHQTRIIEDGMTLPDVPEEVLQRYTVAYDIITYVRQNGYKVCIKDASLGTGFPVVCACIIDLNTGRYHTHFGAYPIFEIALERSLTESFQGRNIRTIATFEDFSHRKSGDFSLADLSNELTMGTWQKRSSFFVGEPDRPFDQNVGFPGGNNRELLRQCVAYFRELGYDILVRDRSCLGFPTCQVIIPGYSESHINRLDQKMDDHRYALYAAKVLRAPAEASIPDMLGLLMHMDQMGKFTSNIRGVYGFPMCAKLSASPDEPKERHLMFATMAYVNYTLGRNQQVIKYINAMLPYATPEDTGYLICLKRYCDLSIHGHTDAQAKQVIRFFHDAQHVQRLLTYLDKGENPLSPFILRCDLRGCEDCLLYGSCYQKRVKQLSALLDQKMASLSFDEYAASLQEILR